MSALKVKFRGYLCALRFGYYPNGRIALQLVGADEATLGAVIATASVNALDDELPNGAIFVKDWSENVGMIDALADAGVIEREACGEASLGRVRAKAHKLTPEAAIECLEHLRAALSERRAQQAAR